MVKALSVSGAEVAAMNFCRKDSGSSMFLTSLSTNACTGCPSSACAVCGVVLPGDVIIIHHQVKGKRHLSDKAVHYLSHGLTHYETGYIYRGEPVTVDLDLSELEGYLQPI